MKIERGSSWLEEKPKKKYQAPQPKGEDFESHLRKAMGVELYEKFRVSQKGKKK
jgi:hypothetical protein